MNSVETVAVGEVNSVRGKISDGAEAAEDIGDDIRSPLLDFDFRWDMFFKREAYELDKVLCRWRPQECRREKSSSGGSDDDHDKIEIDTLKYLQFLKEKRPQGYDDIGKKYVMAQEGEGLT